jgi:hypothetical protein
MKNFTHKELGLISLFEDVSDEHDMSGWLRDVERLPGIRAALVMREVLLNKVRAPLEVQQEIEEIEDKLRGALNTVEELNQEVSSLSDASW